MSAVRQAVDAASKNQSSVGDAAGWGLPSIREHLGFYSALAAAATIVGGTTLYFVKHKRSEAAETHKCQAVDYAEALIACDSLAKQRQ